MKNKVAIINLYFGTLPKWFEAWLKSCEYNSDFTWILFTDDDREYDYPKNVIRIQSSFKQVIETINKELKIETKIYSPYKLCDFKVAYGYIFREYLKDYTHWGYCDLDMIFGDLSKFIDDDLLDNYDRILSKGHLTIFKNNEAVNKYYELNYTGVNYKEVFTSKYHYGFDEISGLDKIYKENNLAQYIPNPPIIADIDFSNYDFRIIGRENYVNQFFVWDDGEIYRYYIRNNKEYKENYAYIHFQKRNLNFKKEKGKKIYIYPEAIQISEKNSDLYELNKYNFFKQINKKITYKKLIICQKIYRLLHWKLKI